MRSLEREKQIVYVSQKLPPIPVVDDYGYETGEYISSFDEPVELLLNVKPITDQAERQTFGTDVSSVRKAVYTPFDVEGFSVEEHQVAWIGIEPNGNLRDDDPANPMNNNYTVEQVLYTGGQFVVYFRKKAGAVKG